MTICACPARVAIAGKMKSGKSTLARLLADYYGVPIHSFATPIKRAAVELGFSLSDKDAVRGVLQELADFCLARNTNHFVDLMSRAVRWDEGVIIDDLRFPWEYEWCQQHGFYVIYLGISAEEQVRRGASPAHLDHESETSLDGNRFNWDYIGTTGVDVDLRFTLVVRSIGPEWLTGWSEWAATERLG